MSDIISAEDAQKSLPFPANGMTINLHQILESEQGQELFRELKALKSDVENTEKRSNLFNLIALGSSVNTIGFLLAGSLTLPVWHGNDTVQNVLTGIVFAGIIIYKISSDLHANATSKHTSARIEQLEKIFEMSKLDLRISRGEVKTVLATAPISAL